MDKLIQTLAVVVMVSMIILMLTMSCVLMTTIFKVLHSQC